MALSRRLDLADAVLVGLGAIVGGGVFVALGLATEMAGPAMLLSLALAGAVALINGLASASLAAVYPEAGGVYVYARRLVHPLAGYLAGWMFLAGKVASAAAVAGVFAAYITPTAPLSIQRAIAVGLVVALTALNIAGVRASLRVNGVLVAIKLAALGFLVGLALPQLDIKNFQPFAPFGFEGIWQAAALLFFAFTGYARLSTIAEEVRDPERTIPRAIALSVVLSLALYLVVAAASIGVAGMLFTGHDLAGRPYNAPLLIVASLSSMPSVARAIVTLGAVVATASILLTLLWGMSRTAFAMARNADLPPFLAGLLPGPDVPWLSLILVGGLSAVVAAVGTPPGLLAASAFAVLVYYAGANACALVAKHDGVARRAFYVVGLVACLALALSLPRATVVSGLIVLAVGLATYPLRALWRR